MSNQGDAVDLDAASAQDSADIQLEIIEFDARQDDRRIMTPTGYDLAQSQILTLEAELRDLQQKVVEVSARLQCLRVAVAPHKRLPPEVLAHIFMLTLPKHGRMIVPRSNEKNTLPRTLRDVCSHWRALVDNMPALWGTIRLVNTNGSGVEDSWGRLHPIHLPPTGPLAISMTSYPEHSTALLLKTLVVQNISRLHALHLHIISSTFLTLFNLDAADTRHLNSVTLNFTKNSRLSHDPGTGPRHPSLLPFFEKLANLRSLKMVFDSPRECPCSLLLSDLLDARFPAQEITNLDIIEHNEIEVRDIERILRRFTKLRRFAARVYWLNPKGASPAHLDLPHLCSLSLTGHYPRLNESQFLKRWDDADVNLFTRPTPLNIPWNMLHHLNTGNIAFDLSTLCMILSQCTALMTFAAELGSSSTGSVAESESNSTTTPTFKDNGGIIALPMLSTMKLKLADGCLLDRLLLPRLRYLKISHTHLKHLESCADEPPLVVPEIISMISRSGCVLLTLSLSGHVPPTESTAMEDLLELVDEVIKFRLKYQRVGAELYERISSGELLPQVSNWKDCRVSTTY